MPCERKLAHNAQFVAEVLSHIPLDNFLDQLYRQDILSISEQMKDPARSSVKTRASYNRAFGRMHPTTQRIMISTAYYRKLGQSVPSLKKRRSLSATDVLSFNTLDAYYTAFDPKSFGVSVSEYTAKDCIRKFIAATSEDALREDICACCARRQNHHAGRDILIKDIPHKHNLATLYPHPLQFTIDGALLHEPGIRNTAHGQEIFLCNDCNTALSRDEVPRFSLANNNWIGEAPLELTRLNPTEQILIAKVICTGNVVKLYPREVNARSWSSAGMYAGLKGNVSSFPLNPNNVVGAVTGQLLPHPPSVLPSIFSVSFVGPSMKGVPGLPGSLKVRRKFLYEALTWLAANNPLYKDVVIDDSILNMYPEDDVPDILRDLVRVTDDIEALETERSGYVPDNDDPNLGADDGYDDDIDTYSDSEFADGEDISFDDAELNNEEEDEAYVSLQAVGLVDLEGNTIPDSEIVSLAAKKMLLVRDEHYHVPHGRRFVCEYPRMQDGAAGPGTPEDPNVILGCYPVLYPYGMGGPDISRTKKMSFEAHSRWALQYADRRFRTNSKYILHIYGILVKRQIASSSTIQTKQSSFQTVKSLLSRLTTEDFDQAKKEEEQKLPFSNPIMKRLRYHISCTRARVIGTDESKRRIREWIFSISTVLSLPHIWLTLNPSDTNDPIAQWLAGEDVSLDQFVQSLGPDSIRRAEAMARDPYASSQFFFVVVNAILEHLFGISVSSNRIHRREGILGRVAAYVGAVEEQRRGALHVHFLIWLEDAPTPSQMSGALKDPEFRERLTAYLKTTVLGDITGKNTQQLAALPKLPSPSYRRPLNPDCGQWREKFLVHNALCSRSVQLHKCSPNTCLVRRRGREVCKRRAPFELADDTKVTETGEFTIKRKADMLNNWNPYIMEALSANHDIKFLLNLFSTALIAFYIAFYATKKRSGSLNTSAVLARRRAYHSSQEAVRSSVLGENDRFLQRCANALTTQQEISVVMAVAYLMGWNDRFVSHSFSIIFLNSLYKHVKDVFPQFRLTRGTYNQSDTESDKLKTLEMVEGSLVVDSQTRDYVDRGDALSHLSYYEFFLLTYDAPFDPKNDESACHGTKRFGPHRSTRVPYANRPGSKRCRVVRQNQERIMPHFTGNWFPDRSKIEEHEYYCAVMLAFLKPWRELREISECDQPFSFSFATFYNALPPQKQRLLENIQLFHDCSAQAREACDSNYPDHPANHSTDEGDMSNTEMEALNNFEETEEDLRRALRESVSEKERCFAEAAVGIAGESNIFRTRDGFNVLTGEALASVPDDDNTFENWEGELAKTIPVLPENDVPVAVVAGKAPTPVIPMPLGICPIVAETSNAIPNSINLNKDQLAPFQFVEHHLEQTLRDRNPAPLRMLVLGEGGTGKSTLINAITDLFKRKGADCMLSKTATTGVAGVNIGGCTIHSWASLSINTRQSAARHDENIRATNKHKNTDRVIQTRYLIVDEISMMDKATLGDLSAALTKLLLQKDGPIPADCSFGNLNIILTGDFHQFPPVARAKFALYMPDSKDDDDRTRFGSLLYQEFKVVFILKTQMRTRDPIYSAILRRMRTGDCTANDVNILKTLVLEKNPFHFPDSEGDDWRRVTLVTPRNATRDAWNAAALESHSLASGNRIYRIPASDSVGRRPSRRPLTLSEKIAVARSKVKAKSNLADTVEIAIGMRGVVTHNVSTAYGIANGSRGHVVAVTLDRRETQPPSDQRIVQLHYAPAVVLFQLECISEDVPTFPGLDRGVVPLFPTELSFRIAPRTGGHVMVHRFQLPLTGGYAFTDYKAQGQTIKYLLIDLGKLPNGALSAAAVYVALSRGRSRDSVRILRLHDETVFTKHPCEYLRAETERFEAIDLAMRRVWGISS